MKPILAILGVVISALQYSVSAPVCLDLTGSVERVLYHSELVEDDFVYSVYLPPCYEQGTRSYPVLYLLHGLRSNDSHWQQLGLVSLLNELIASGTLPPLIVVMPYGGTIANVNAFGTSSWPSVFIYELMPNAETKYRVTRDPTLRGIGGISRGGFWAYYIAFKFPGRFSVVGGHSAAFSVSHQPPQFNPLTLAETTPDLETVRFWLDRAPLDPGRGPLDLLATAMKSRGLSLQYKIYPSGEHENSYWAAHLNDYLSFYAATWPR